MSIKRGSPKREAEEAHKNKIRFETLKKLSRIGIYDHMVPPDENTYHSDGWASILGYKRSELPSYDKFVDS
jgi:hypothetical protein